VVGVGHYQKIQLFCQPLSLKVKAVRDEVQQKFSFEAAEKGGEVKKWQKRVVKSGRKRW
jgi:chromosome condensin MukBEF complex kleisin-like MukF subunit